MLSADVVLFLIAAAMLILDAFRDYRSARKGRQWAIDRRQEIYCTRAPKLTRFVLDLYAEVQQAFEVCQAIILSNVALLLLVLSLLLRTMRLQ